MLSEQDQRHRLYALLFSHKLLLFICDPTNGLILKIPSLYLGTKIRIRLAISHRVTKCGALNPRPCNIHAKVCHLNTEPSLTENPLKGLSTQDNWGSWPDIPQHFQLQGLMSKRQDRDWARLLVSILMVGAPRLGVKEISRCLYPFLTPVSLHDLSFFPVGNLSPSYQT